MHSAFVTDPARPAIPVIFATRTTWEAVSADLPTQGRQFARANGFNAKPGACLPLPSAGGEIAQVLFGLDDEKAKFRDPFRPGQLPALLPPGLYRFANIAPNEAHLSTLAFALGSYRFSRYRKSDPLEVMLVPPNEVDIADIARMAEAAALARDLINTPSNDMGPE